MLKVLTILALIVVVTPSPTSLTVNVEVNVDGINVDGNDMFEKAINGAPIDAAPEEEKMLDLIRPFIDLIKDVFEMIKDFKQTDTDVDGKLSVEEMNTALSGMQLTENRLEPVLEYFNKQLEEFDSNGDGNISLFEVVGKLSNLSEVIAKIMEMMSGEESANRSESDKERLLGMIKSIYEMMKVFKQADTDGNGKLSVEEMKTALSRMQMTEYLPEPALEYFNKQLEELDSNGDGNISVFEVVGMLSNVNAKIMEMMSGQESWENRSAATAEERQLDLIKYIYEMINVFKQTDLNGDGKLSVDEMKASLSGIFRYFSKRLEELDSNGDGKISLSEVLGKLYNVSEDIAKIMDWMSKESNVYDVIKVFMQTDTDGNGQLSVEEMKTALSGMQMNEYLPEPVLEYFNKQLEEFDSNGDRNISLFEVFGKLLNVSEVIYKFIMELMSGQESGENRSAATEEERLLGLIKNIYKMIKVLKQTDANGDGELSVDEMKAALSEIFQYSDKQLEEFDSNGDGHISLSEVVGKLSNVSKVIAKIMDLIVKRVQG